MWLVVFGYKLFWPPKSQHGWAGAKNVPGLFFFFGSYPENPTDPVNVAPGNSDLAKQYYQSASVNVKSCSLNR